MTTLVIARHGNTFAQGESSRRIGWRTDLPLTEAGWEQARAIGHHLKKFNLMPDAIFTGRTRRTMETAWIAMIEAKQALHIQPDSFFNEFDYGPDENKTEEEVAARIGASAVKAWDERAVVPPGWNINPQALIDGWKNFGYRINKDYSGCTILAVTSNGVARFAPHLTGDFDDFSKTHPIKMVTGSLSVMNCIKDKWTVELWNIRP